MRLYLVNPDNPVVSLNKVHWNRLNTYRVWKPLGLLVVAGLTPPAWEVSLDAPGFPVTPPARRPGLVAVAPPAAAAPAANCVMNSLRFDSAISTFLVRPRAKNARLHGAVYANWPPSTNN